MCAGRFQLPLPTLASSSEPRPFGSEGSGRQDIGLQAMSSTLRSVYAWEADVCYPLGHGSWNSYTPIEEGCWKSLYSTQIHGSSGQCSHMLFPQPLPATNMRMLAAPSTVKQDAGGWCHVLSSLREACLEASCQLAAFLWQGEGSSILRQEVPRLPLYCTWNYPPGLHC